MCYTLAFIGAISNEKNCGRPLGIRVKSGIIYVVDAYLGLFKVSVNPCYAGVSSIAKTERS